jgi:hypothetical protein
MGQSCELSAKAKGARGRGAKRPRAEPPLWPAGTYPGETKALWGFARAHPCTGTSAGAGVARGVCSPNGGALGLQLVVPTGAPRPGVGAITGCRAIGGRCWRARGASARANRADPWRNPRTDSAQATSRPCLGASARSKHAEAHAEGARFSDWIACRYPHPRGRPPPCCHML